MYRDFIQSATRHGLVGVAFKSNRARACRRLIKTTHICRERPASEPPRAPAGWGEAAFRDFFCAIWMSCETRNSAKFARGLGAGPVFGQGRRGIAMGARVHSEAPPQEPMRMQVGLNVRAYAGWALSPQGTW